MSNSITNTQIQSIEAKTLLTHFENLNNRLDQLQNTVKPQPKTILLTRKEVAKLLDISLPTLWAWTNKNILISYRIGNKIRYKENEVLEALQCINSKQ
jgi:excisionase family DNA binding protein